MIALPDVNVLLSLAWANHPHHKAAHDWLARDRQAGWATCLLTQAGFLRLSLNPHVVGVAIDCAGALASLASMIADPQHQFVELAPTLTAAPFDALVPKIIGHQQVSMLCSCIWPAAMA